MRARIVAAAIVLFSAAACAPSGVDDASQPGCRSLVGGGRQGAFGAYGTEERGILILAAQAVPSATLLPCVDAYPVGWTFSGWNATNGGFRFWLDSDRAGFRAVEVVLAPSCDVGDAVEVVPGDDEVGTRRFEEPLSLPPAYAANRYYTFEGGCVEYRYRFRGNADAALALEADRALAFRPRVELVEDLDRIGLLLCGADAPPCAGEER